MISHFYILQSHFQALQQKSAQLQLLCTPHDGILLMGDCLNLLYLDTSYPCTLYVLESEASLIVSTAVQPFQIIGYAQLSDLLINSNRVITLK